jgi:hypothetical protein
MADLSVDTEAVRAFAATQEGVAAQVADAGNVDAAGNVAAMTPVFGLIGADYLAMFAAAQVLHAQDINDLAGKVNHIGQAAFGTVAVVTDTDQSSASALGAVTNPIGG